MSFRLALLTFLLSAHAAMADFDAAMTFYQKRDFNSAFSELKRLAEIGDHDAQFNVGVMYYRGEGVEKNAALGFSWISLAAESGGKDAENRKNLANKIFLNLDQSEKESAEKLRAELIENLSDAAIAKKTEPVLTSSGFDNHQRVTKSVTPVYPQKMLTEGKMGVVDLIYGVGKDGTARDIGILMASDKGFVNSAVNALKARQFAPAIVNEKPVEVYGEILRVVFLIDGVTFKESKVLEDIRKLREKAEHGTPSDQFQYAYFMQVIPSFTHVDIDTSDANSWYYNSAKAGNTKAQFFLGKNLLYGQACSADAQKSLYWLEKAAAQGAPDAQYLLAIEMLNGARLGYDKSAALRWLQKAAESNSTNAQLRLAWILSTDADKSVRNAALAKSYIDKVPESFFDKRSLYEARASVAAELGKFSDAIAWQEKAVLELKEYELPYSLSNARLETYRGHHALME